MPFCLKSKIFIPGWTIGRILRTRVYGNMGCGVFKGGGTKLEIFLPKEIIEFENWVYEEVSKSAKI